MVAVIGLLAVIVGLAREGDFHGHPIFALYSESKILSERNAGLIALACRRAFTEVSVFRTISNEAEMLKFVFDSGKIGVQVIPCSCFRYLVSQEVPEITDAVKC